MQRVVYDLSSFVAQDRLDKRSALWLRVTLSAAIPLFYVYSFWSDLSAIRDGHLQGVALDVTLGVGSVVALLSSLAVVTLPQLLPGATSISVDDRGLGLTYSSGAVAYHEWASDRFAATLIDFTGIPMYSKLASTRTLHIPDPRSWLPTLHPTTLLSEEAATAILSTAAACGLEIRKGLGSARRYGGSPVVYRIRGRAAKTAALGVV